MTEEHFIESLKQGSQEAFQELVEKFGRRLYAVSFRLLRSSADAEDTVQEAFLKAFRALESFREEASLYSWLYRIATNESLMRLRKRGHQKTVSLEDYLPQFEIGQHTRNIEDWSKLPDDAFETAELQRFLEQCIEELPEDYRAAYILKDIEGLSEEEVSNTLNISKAAMKNRVHRARLVIRERVEEKFLRNA